jgi:hypothetical protein
VNTEEPALCFERSGIGSQFQTFDVTQEHIDDLLKVYFSYAKIATNFLFTAAVTAYNLAY